MKVFAIRKKIYQALCTNIYMKAVSLIIPKKEIYGQWIKVKATSSACNHLNRSDFVDIHAKHEDSN